MNVSMKWNVPFTKYRVALSLLDVSVLLSRTQKPRRIPAGGACLRLRGLQRQMHNCCCCRQDWRWWLKLALSSHTFSWVQPLQGVWPLPRKDLILTPFLSVILHYSYLSPQYPLKRLVCVQLCISGRAILTCPSHFSGLFSLSSCQNVVQDIYTEVFMATT